MVLFSDQFRSGLRAIVTIYSRHVPLIAAEFLPVGEKDSAGDCEGSDTGLTSSPTHRANLTLQFLPVFASRAVIDGQGVSYRAITPEIQQH